MNRQIVQLFGLVTVLFALLVVFTSRWTVFEAAGLEDNANNRRPLLQEQRTPRGRIFASDGRTVLARSVPHGRGEDRTYSRVYPEDGLFAHAVGYSFLLYGRRGLERSRNDELAGKEDEFETILSGLRTASARARTWSPTWTWTASARRSPPSGAARAPWWRSSPPPARCG